MTARIEIILHDDGVHSIRSLTDERSSVQWVVEHLIGVAHQIAHNKLHAIPVIPADISELDGYDAQD